LGDRDARESSREEEGRMHVEVSFSDIMGKEIVKVPLGCTVLGLKKNDRF
jgi:hypothetical protein